MLTALAIRDIVLIEALDLEFSAGLTALTGETGAGKSILLDALGLALGARADSGLVRDAQAQASVVATFEVATSHPAYNLLGQNDIIADAGEPLLIRRSLKADGGSRAFINDQPVSAALLREVGATLVEIHGQYDDRGLMNARGHRALLDSFARSALADVQKCWSALQAAQTRLEQAQQDLDTAMRDREWLEHAVTELTAVNAEIGEEDSLAQERATMQKGARLADDLVHIHHYFDGSEGGLASLRQAARRLDRLAEEHPLLTEALAALDRAVIEATECEEKLTAASEALAFDPARLDAAETRLFEIRALARKHGVEPDALPDLTQKLTARLTQLQDGSAGIAVLEADVRACRAAYDRASDTLTLCRVDAGKRLDKAVAGELAPLKLDAARFRTIIEPLAENQWGPSGKDRVEFEISTNPGAPFAPLAKIASGGELSRFILALKVALAEAASATTMIFDEIDRGVGGAVASAIGERLARLSGTAQLLVVTHSPQVAARATDHFLISKSHDGHFTRTSLAMLNAVQRQEEIARMLSGETITDEARAQANRLLSPA